MTKSAAYPWYRHGMDYVHYSVKVEDTLVPKIATNIIAEKFPKACLTALRDVICTYYRITATEFHSTSRKRPIPEAKQLFCFIANVRLFREMTQTDIGRFIRYKPAADQQYGRTNVVHAVKCIQDLLDTKVLLYSTLIEIIRLTTAKLNELYPYLVEETVTP